MEKILQQILLADDDEEDRQIIKDTFDDLGFGSCIQFVEDGEKAIDYLHESLSKQSIPCLIILDLNMPRLNGTQTLRYLKDHPQFKDITVVIYSTSLNPIERDECLALGAHSYVIKPVSYSQSIDVANNFYHICTQLSK